jgi:hypothetical protein
VFGNPPNVITETDDIEIPANVLAVGIEEYGLFDAADPSEWVVTAVYRAMLREAIKSGHIQRVTTDPRAAAVA